VVSKQFVFTSSLKKTELNLSPNAVSTAPWAVRPHCA